MALSSFFALLLGKIVKVANIAKIIAIVPKPFIFNVSNVLQYFINKKNCSDVYCISVITLDFRNLFAKCRKKIKRNKFQST